MLLDVERSGVEEAEKGSVVPEFLNRMTRTGEDRLQADSQNVGNNLKEQLGDVDRLRAEILGNDVNRSVSRQPMK
jgi:hypothetical protein